MVRRTKHCPEHPFLEVLELLRQTHHIPWGSQSFSQELVLSWRPGSAHLPAPLSRGVHWLHLPWSLITGKVLVTFFHLSKSLEISPANESLQSWYWPSNQTIFALSVHHRWSSRDCNACSIEDHHHGPASHDTAKWPAVCCSSPSSPRSTPSTGSATHGGGLAFHPRSRSYIKQLVRCHWV